jgi:N-acetyl-alpha-D-muramate 1-phosphate uridylyltransferase
MKGMILAAGFGTRLAPLTDTIPKALIPVAGRPMIDHAVLALKALGCTSVIVNCHHQADAVVCHCMETDFGVNLSIIREENILGTGGGILNAQAFFDGKEQFIVHNADIVSEFPLERLCSALKERNAIAALALHRGATSRGVLFDKDMNFLGKESWTEEGWAFPEQSQRFGFCGIHVIHPDIFQLGFSQGFSDIFDLYKLALLQKKTIAGVVFDEYWTDLGTMEKIRAHEARLR